jgi:hypothetical protein
MLAWNIVQPLYLGAGSLVPALVGIGHVRRTNVSSGVLDLFDSFALVCGSVLFWPVLVGKLREDT